jgi:AcrR family transcriptional regulator
MTEPLKSIKDRRVQKTQTLLRQALLSLLAEKPYDAIVIKEILDRANVGRSTFYMHFRDKDDLLVTGIDDMIGAVESPTPVSSGKPYNALLWFSLPVFEHHHRHAHAWGDRIGARGRAILHEHLRQVLAKRIGGVVKKELRGTRNMGQIPADLLSEYVASTFVLVLNWWLDGKMPIPPKQIDILFRTLTSPTMAAVWDKK